MSDLAACECVAFSWNNASPSSPRNEIRWPRGLAVFQVNCGTNTEMTSELGRGSERKWRQTDRDYIAQEKALVLSLESWIVNAGWERRFKIKGAPPVYVGHH